MSYKKGFTLIEVIVVLIILGVLAGIALASYFDWIRRSHRAEGLVAISAIKSQLTACLMLHSNNPQLCMDGGSFCNQNYNSTQLNISDEAVFVNNCWILVRARSPHFIYVILTGTNLSYDSGGNLVYDIDQNANTFIAYYIPDIDNSFIRLSYNSATNQVSCTSQGLMQGAC